MIILLMSFIGSKIKSQNLNVDNTRGAFRAVSYVFSVACGDNSDWVNTETVTSANILSRVLRVC